MALRQIVLAQRIQQRQASMQALVRRREELRARREALAAREEELSQAVGEVNEETPQEDRDALDAQVNQWEQDEKALQTDETENETAISQEQTAIDDLQKELDEINDRGTAKPVKPEQKPEERKERTTMSKYNTRRLWFGMDHQERDAFLANEETKSFLAQVRSMVGQTRAVENATLTIPPIVAPVLREIILVNSQLLKYVNVMQVSGDVRQPVMGTPGEAVWTEMCAVTNEMDLGFGLVQVDGYMVSAFIPLCNAVKDDSDLDLATISFEAIGHGIAVAIDKAILFGKGVNMPLGILTRLEQTQKPADYPAYAPEWKNLSKTNIKSVTGKTDLALLKAIVEASGVAKSKYSAGGKFWAMNDTTRTKLLSNAMSITAGGAIVSGQTGVMPVIGGDIVVIDDVPDDVIIGGYGKLYTVGERQSKTFSMSEHVRFLQNQTVFKGVARYDGKPAIAEGFVAIGINGNTPTAADVTFAADKENQV